MTLGRFCHSVADTVTVDCLTPGARIQWQVTTHLPPVWADEVYLEEIIRNLLINADKYTPPTTPIDIAVLVEEHCLKIMLTDYGPGVPIDAQEKIWNRFYRQESGDRSHESWVGIRALFCQGINRGTGWLFEDYIASARLKPKSRVLLQNHLAIDQGGAR